ncbi:Tmem144 [Symbiodinium natans]|uniref:Tmem144 protein n=1 Tax=Symbiodinium natans TaxID=878477 RepID=A0A812PWS0_9DINO|nr:Tmem144 [Symbiodinium natans]
MSHHSFQAWIAVLVATLGFGSLYVPVKNYEIHDGLVYQWFQCCGILLAGLIYACCRNDWDAVGRSSPGFYVCREGLLSGLFFQLANVLATQSVKSFGMSNYFTTQKVTNLGGALFLGLYGSQLGLPSVPPRSPAMAIAGSVCVVVAMVPLAFTKLEGKEPPPSTASASPALPDRRPHLIPPHHGDMGGYIMLEDDPQDPADNLTVTTLSAGDAGTPRHAGRSSWFVGLAWSLLAGLAFAAIYVPILPWRHRMKEQRVVFSPFDYFLSISVGLFMASTAYMFAGGAFRKLQGKKMKKSVLRPALLNGMMWSAASMAQLYALAEMPYAVAYCLVCGGEVAVSLLWGICVFKEATTAHNLRCTLVAFCGVVLGVVLVAFSK